MSRRVRDLDVARLAGQLQTRLDALADRLTDRILAEVDFYAAGTVVGRDELRGSVRHNFAYMLGQLSAVEEPDLSAPRQTGRRRAEQGAPLPEILRAYRLGFAFLWEELAAEARSCGRDTVRALLDTATEIWSLADDYSLALTDAYRDAMAERMLAADRHRSALVQALITGGVDHGTAWEVAKQLDFPFEGRFLVVVAENTALGAAPLPDVEGRLRSFDVTSAWRLQPDFEVGLLSCGRRLPVEMITNVLEALATARVGVSPLYPTLDQTPRAMRFAQTSLETLPSGAKGIRQLEDNPLGELVAGSLDTTRRVVHRVLGGVLALPEEERRTLLSTVQAWMDAHGSATEAGRMLFCHPNTVRYRLRRLEEHTGRSLDDPRAVAELAAALQALKVFPMLTDRAM